MKNKSYPRKVETLVKYLLEEPWKKVIMEVYLKSSWRRKVHLNKRRRNLGRRFFTAQKAPVANIWGPINVMNYLKRLSHRCKIVRILLPLLHPFRGWIRACNGVHSSEIGVFIFKKKIWYPLDFFSECCRKTRERSFIFCSY